MKHAIKGEITLEFLIKIALFAVVVLLFVLPLVVKLYELLGGRAKPATINSMELLAKEIKYMEAPIVIPLFIDNKHIIKGFDIASSDRPTQCKTGLSCLCTCKLDGCTPKSTEKCVNLEYSISTKKLHIENLVLNPTERVTNFHVELLGDTVSIIERPGVSLG
ncbi:MAG: hypothetical protein ABIJ34_00610 [archaeon]